MLKYTPGFIVIAFLIFISSNSFSQIPIQLEDSVVLCDGDSVRIIAGPCGFQFFDDFDPDVDSTLWLEIHGMANNNCGAFSAPNAMHFNDGFTRQVTTNAIDTRWGGTVSFQLKIAGSNLPGCETAEIGDDVVLEYSNTSFIWVTINQYSAGSFPSFVQINEPIPFLASETSYFRWRQVIFSGQALDNWAIDDVRIDVGCCDTNCPPYQYVWSPSAGVSDTSIADPQFYPVSSSTYYVSVIGLFGDTIVDSVYVEVTNDCCQQTTNLTANSTASSAVLSWDSVAGATSYMIEIDTGSKISSPPLFSIQTDSVIIEIDSLLMQTHYVWRVRAVCMGDTGKWSADTFSTISSGLNSMEKESFKIYPNPTSGSFTIKASQQGFHLMIKSIDGRLIFQKSIDDSSYRLDKGILIGGVYLVELMQNGESTIEKVVVLE